MRRLLVAAMLVVFASLNAIDGICCPDGCTHPREAASQQSSNDSGDASCLLCVGAIEPAAAPALASAGLIATPIGDLPVRSHLDALSNPPDHPPRA